MIDASRINKNMLLKYGERKIRVLAIRDNKLLVIDCVKQTMPVWMPYEGIQEYEEVALKDVQDDLEDLSPEARKAAYWRYGVIVGILPYVDQEDLRSEMIERAAAENGISKQTVRSYLCRYLVSQSVRGLVPKEKNVGRPLTDDEKNIRKALNKWYYTTKKRTLKNTYTLMLRNYYCDIEGKLMAEYPSYWQFRYFFRKYNKKQTEFISREGLSAYQRNHRPLVGDGIQSYAPAPGVGMLDSTICDIYLVNENGVVGRPVLNACVDAYSGLCCGYSLNFEGGIYSLCDLMRNVVTDKVRYCLKFGIKITEEEWPCNTLLGKLVTDMGSEYKGNTFGQITDLGVQLHNLPAYRPELKSAVEKFFDAVQGYYKPYLKGKGVVEPDYQERGAVDYRKQACLTIAEFERIIINCIIFYNSKRILERFPYTKEMLTEQIPPHPNTVWRWGCKQEGCNLIECSEEQIVMTLLPRTGGRFSRNGLLVNDMRYHNEKFAEMYLCGGECTVAYNPDDVGVVWLLEKGIFEPFELIESRFRDKDLEDVYDMKQKQKTLVKIEQSAKVQAEVDLARKITAIADNADSFPNASVKDIRQNRKIEQGRRHKDFVVEVLKNV